MSVESPKPSFEARLINGPFGDPGLHIHLLWQGTALQFDLGRMDRLPAAEIQRLSHVFVSHTHMDHFYGFDRLLRVMLARDATVNLFGPAGMIANVQGRLAGYTWNLTEGYPLELVVHEIHADRILRVALKASTGFTAEAPTERPFDGVLATGKGWRVEAAILNHKIPCLAFALSEDRRLNVSAEALTELGAAGGPWIQTLKQAVRDELPDDTIVRASWRAGGQEAEAFFPLGELRRRIITESPGQKVAYVVDTLFSRDNAQRIARLAHHADTFYCESLFLDEDRSEALKRHHLTARQAGSLGRMAEVRNLEVFHFSPRYDRRAQEIYDEAAATFRGDLPPDDPVDIPG